MPSVLNTDPIPSVPKCNWCTKRNNVTSVPKMTKNAPSVPVFGSVRFYMDFRKNPLLVSKNSTWRTATTFTIVLGRIFLFSYCILSSTSGGFRIVSDTLVSVVVDYWRPVGDICPLAPPPVSVDVTRRRIGVGSMIRQQCVNSDLVCNARNPLGKLPPRGSSWELTAFPRL